ncbi:unnamed protein product [Hymenolepis diminuta]|uniref:RING-type domain-containing protein n=1 Tax=Hymenolepis diminuta TaxID=6216 RepID=A0A158QDI8_HYMDI|nr:unnamed protein product [Hymenolepis diminuta]
MKRKLTAATRKALKQLPVKFLNQVDPLISEGFDQCAICIEIFKPHDLIRSLPCRHMYHRACIDPWLLKHRSCPLCKQNILIACGLSLTDEDIESCSATTSEVNSAFSLSSTSTSSSNISTSVSSPGMDGSVFCLPLLTILNCRRHRRYRRRQHLYRYTEHLRRPGSFMDEVSAPLADGGRRVLGSASENSSSSRSVPSDLYCHGNMDSEKGARFTAEEYEEEGSSFAGRRRRRSVRRVMIFRQGRLRHGWRAGNLMLSSCCRSGISSRGTGQVTKDREIISPPPQQQPSSPLMYQPLPSVAHPSAMLLYHLPQSLPFTQIPSATKAALPSYEQATASIPQAAFVALPGPHQSPPPPVVSWNPHFTTKAHHQVALARFFDPQPPNRSGAKTDVVYAVLSNSTARMSVTEGPSPANPAAIKPPIFVDVNPPLMGSSGTLLGTAWKGPAHQCLLSNAAPFTSVATATSPPLIIQPRGESPPPAYSLATGEKPTAGNTPLHPIRRAARFLVTHFLYPQSVKQFRQQHQHHYYHHQKQQSRHRYYTSFLGALKPSSRSHHSQHCNGNIRLKTRTPRRLHEVTSASIIMTRNGRSHSHRRSDRECQRSVVGSGGGVLAKTLDLTHEGLIMTAASMESSSVNVIKTPSTGEVMSPSVGRKNSPNSGGPPQRLTTHSNSESSSEGTHRGIPLRHTRVRSVRVTVEPQIQYHMERDAASCEALHDSSLHTLSGSKISLPRANSLPPSLKPVIPDGIEVRVIKINEDGVPATGLWHCRPSVGSAPALCNSPNSNTTNNHKPPSDILNRSDTILHSSSSSSSF